MKAHGRAPRRRALEARGGACSEATDAPGLEATNMPLAALTVCACLTCSSRVDFNGPGVAVAALRKVFEVDVLYQWW